MYMYMYMYMYIYHNIDDIKRGHDQVILHHNQVYKHISTYVMNMI